MANQKPLSVAAVALRDLVAPTKKSRTQAGLADELGVTASAVSAWVHGIARPDPEKMAKLEELLGIPMRDWTTTADDALADTLPPGAA